VFGVGKIKKRRPTKLRKGEENKKGKHLGAVGLIHENGPEEGPAQETVGKTARELKHERGRGGKTPCAKGPQMTRRGMKVDAVDAASTSHRSDGLTGGCSWGRGKRPLKKKNNTTTRGKRMPIPQEHPRKTNVTKEAGHCRIHENAGGEFGSLGHQKKILKKQSKRKRRGFNRSRDLK